MTEGTEMREAENVKETVQALGKAWDKWPIITCCGIIALGSLLVQGYTMYRLFGFLEGLRCAGGG